MSTTRRELLIAGLAATATGVAPTHAGTPGRFRLAIAGDYEGLALQSADWRSLGDDVEIVAFTRPFRSARETARALRDFDAVALMRERVPMPRQVLQQLPRLKLIVFSGLMNDTLDHAVAAERNIIVCRSVGLQREERSGSAPRVGGGAPSELALALIMACARRIPAADALVRRGDWTMPPGIPLRGKVLGIVGYGGIGKPVAGYGLALGMHVLGFSRSLTDAAARADGIARADLETLLRTADVVSIHLPLTRATTGMIGAREIGWMKPGAILVNTARAPILDERAVLDALRTRRIAMAGFDVFWEEPVPADHPLLKLPNVVLTPHIGYVSASGMVTRYRAMLEVFAAYRQGTIKDRYTPPPET